MSLHFADLYKVPIHVIEHHHTFLMDVGPKVDVVQSQVAFLRLHKVNHLIQHFQQPNQIVRSFVVAQWHRVAERLGKISVCLCGPKQ